MSKYINGLEYIRSRGYQIVEGKYVISKYGYLAGSDDQRAFDFNEMFANPEVKAIFCTRGGYGTPRILNKIDYDLVRQNPKILVGYSDITALQLALFSQAGLITFSGPMVAVDMTTDIHNLTEGWLWNVVTNDKLKEIPLDDGPANVKVFNRGAATGRLLGGCFAVLVALLGTKYIPDLTDSILLLEDVNEDLYKIDRYFSQLYLAGILNKVKGIILGDFVLDQPEETEKDKEFYALVNDYIKDLDIPVIGNVPYGHGNIKYTFPIGSLVRLNTNTKKLLIMEPVLNER